jgi:hypothetical protein
VKRWFLFLTFIVLLLLTACSPAGSSMPELLPLVVTVTPEHPNAQPALVTPQASPTAAASFTPAIELSPTIEVTSTPSGPAPSETPLPELVLPTEKANAPALTAWTGLPTYAGDSEPGRLFRLDYDPDVWAQTPGNFGDVVLAQRQIAYCIIAPWSGRGLPADAHVGHEFRLVGTVPYDVNTVSVGGEVRFVAYVGGDQRLLTGFQVSFQDQKEQCLQEAETVLATLRSFAAQPTQTPSATP